MGLRGSDRGFRGAVLPICALFLWGGSGLVAWAENPPLSTSQVPALPVLENEGAYLPAPTSQMRLVIRLSQRRVYVYQDDRQEASYPIAVGKKGWETPTGTFAVHQKLADPAWEHPWTGEVIPAGARNPLGRHWIGFWSDGKNAIGFHGTPNEELVGQAVSHGCIRMKNADIAALFEMVPVGTPVIVER